MAIKQVVLVSGLAVALAGCSLQIGTPQPAVVEVRVPEHAVVTPPVECAAPTDRVLTTRDFESGQCTLNQASSESLEMFLRDLNRRKDYDYRCNNDQPGPNSAYLWQWVQNVVGELQSRGYYFDDAGNFHRPSTIVAIR